MKRKTNLFLSLLVALMMAAATVTSAFAAEITSGDAALRKALKQAGLKKSQVTVTDKEYDSDDGTYEIEFIKKSNGSEYSYEISASSGKILEKSVDIKYKRNSSHKKIGKKAARKKAAKFSGISYKTIKKGSCSYDYDDGKGVYEVKFRKGNRKYECEVLAPTGKVIEYSWKLIKK